jgi:hypothetical protein
MIILLWASCSGYFFHQETSDQEWISEEHLIPSLDALEGVWIGDEALTLSYTAGERVAYLSIHDSPPIAADLEDLTGKRPLVKIAAEPYYEFRIYFEHTAAVDGDWVRVCPREGFMLVNLRNYYAHTEKTYRLAR